MKRDYRSLRAQAMVDGQLDYALGWRTNFAILRAVSILLVPASIAMTIWMVVRTEDIGEFGWGYFLLFASIAPLAALTAVLFTAMACLKSERELNGY